MSGDVLAPIGTLVPQAPASRRLLWIVLAATLAASAWVLTDDEEPQAGPSPPTLTTRREGITRKDGAPASLATAEAPLAVPRRELRLTPPRDLFAALLVAPPPPAAPMVAAPPPPPPPVTLPYTFGGRLLTEQGPSVLLNEGGQTHVLALGNTLGNFRFEQDAGAQIVFIHVPNGERLVLPVPH